MEWKNQVKTLTHNINNPPLFLSNVYNKMQLQHFGHLQVFTYYSLQLMRKYPKHSIGITWVLLKSIYKYVRRAINSRFY